MPPSPGCHLTSAGARDTLRPGGQGAVILGAGGRGYPGHLDILEVGADPARVPLLAPAEDGDHVTDGSLARLREADGRYQAGDLRHTRTLG